MSINDLEKIYGLPDWVRKQVEDKQKLFKVEQERLLLNNDMVVVTEMFKAGIISAQEAKERMDFMQRKFDVYRRMVMPSTNIHSIEQTEPPIIELEEEDEKLPEDNVIIGLTGIDGPLGSYEIREFEETEPEQ